MNRYSALLSRSVILMSFAAALIQAPSAARAQDPAARLGITTHKLEHALENKGGRAAWQGFAAQPAGAPA